MYGEGLGAASLRLVARNRRRYGGYVVHFGIVAMFAAFAGLFFKRDFTEVELKSGDTFTAVDPYGDTWTFTSQGLSFYETLNRRVTAVGLDVRRNGERIGIMTAEKRQHYNAAGEESFQPSTEVAIHETARQDVYVFFSGLLDAESAVLHVHFNPLVVWVWFGGLMMTIGGLIVMWPQGTQRRVQSGYAAEMTPKHDGPALVEAGA